MRWMMGAVIAIALAAAAGHADPNGGAVKPVPAKAPVAKPVKQQTRAELEAEVERLRAENAKLRADLDQMKAREAERTKRMQSAIGSPSTTLK